MTSPVVFVGMTTIPARVPHILPVLSSVARQTFAPAAFFVSVPEFSKRENMPYPLDEISEKLAAAETRFPMTLNMVPDDYGPLTKLVGLLLGSEVGKRGPPDLLVTIDDDAELDPRFLERLVAASARYPGDAVAFCGHAINVFGLLPTRWGFRGPANTLGDALSLPDGARVNVVCGFGGVCYPATAFRRRLDPFMESLRKSYPQLGKNDDLYISAWLARLGVTKRVVSFGGGRHNEQKPLPHANENALSGGFGTRTAWASAKHLKSWLSLIERLQRLNLLEIEEGGPICKNLSIVIPGSTIIVTAACCFILYMWAHRRV